MQLLQFTMIAMIVIDILNMFSDKTYTPSAGRQIVLIGVAQKWNRAHREIDIEYGYFKQNLYCNYPFPIDLPPHRLPIGAKYTGKG